MEKKTRRQESSSGANGEENFNFFGMGYIGTEKGVRRGSRGRLIFRACQGRSFSITPRPANEFGEASRFTATPILQNNNNAHMKKSALLSLLLLTGTTGALRANDAIATVMKNAFKGETSLYTTVAKGKGTQDDARRLAAFVKTLTENEPPRGEKAAWDKRTGDLLRAVDLMAKGSKQAMVQVQNAGNCKSCHSAHKPD